MQGPPLGNRIFICHWVLHDRRDKPALWGLFYKGNNLICEESVLITYPAQKGTTLTLGFRTSSYKQGETEAQTFRL